ncbi:hypothetical protein CAPTEDRAFT_96933 [Capitella teleta]|uniref:NACHT domain-containing protein n=1 Tax=Capitella teleta TaxID=283909 RepID=R7V9C0_CAPTE|nr:hypothetical protein CAPTEDRAFT_96933 [Capitella teleta]|eukprot:ELU12330.1 hypothetical protein CAPTEDRAFT_96933 [Capitella teleta]
MGDRFGWSQQEGSPDEVLNNSFDYAMQNFPHQLGWLDQHRYGVSVTQDLVKLLDEDFPLGTELTALEQEREAHKAFADARCRVYIGREQYFDEINEFMDGTHHTPLVILGESGGGKSALVANWFSRVEQKETDAFVFVHFIGSSAESASYHKVIRRLCEEIKLHFGFSQLVASSDSDLIRDFPLWLKMAGSQSKTIIVMDALNQLDDGTGTEGSEHDLLWIPRVLPPGVSMLLSTLPGRAMEAVKSAGWRSMKVHPLNETEKQEIVTGFLEGIYGKTLSSDQKAMIVGAEQTNNPLYLCGLLDEVRVFGSFRELTSKLAEYLSAATPGELFAKILARLENDFEETRSVFSPRTGLVQDMMKAIWASRRGMSESELLRLLNVPNVVWSPLYLSIVENLVNRNGILNFFHDHLRKAVELRYLSTPEKKKTAYENLADFFLASNEMDDRVADELPFLLSRCANFTRLKSTLSDLCLFSRLIKTEEGKFDLIKYWQMLGDFSEVENVYLNALEHEAHENVTELQKSLAEFFTELGLLSAARSMLERLLVSLEDLHKHDHSVVIREAGSQKRRYRCNHPDVIDIMRQLGTVCEKQVDLGGAKKLYQEAISRQLHLNSAAQKLQLAECLLGYATTLYLLDDMKESRKVLKRAEELAVKVLGGRHHYVSAIINRLGQMSYKQGRLDESLGLFVRDLNLTRNEVGSSHPRSAAVLNDIALVYDDKNSDFARDLYEASLAILLETYGNGHLDVAVIRYNLGAFYLATNCFLRAKFQLNEALKIFETFLGSDHVETLEAKAALAECQDMI